jgi:hypothetical protein
MINGKTIETQSHKQTKLIIDNQLNNESKRLTFMNRKNVFFNKNSS